MCNYWKPACKYCKSPKDFGESSEVQQDRPFIINRRGINAESTRKVDAPQGRIRGREDEGGNGGQGAYVWIGQERADGGSSTRGAHQEIPSYHAIQKINYVNTSLYIKLYIYKKVVF